MYKNYYALGALAVCLLSCNADLESDIEALEAENKAIRNEIEVLLEDTEASDFSTNIDSISEANDALDQLLFDPLTIEHTYSYDGQTVLTDTKAFGFTSIEYQYMYQQRNTPNKYDIYIEMWDNTDGDETARVDFTYDIETKEISSIDYDLDYTNAYGDSVSISDNDEDETEDSDYGELRIEKMNIETGELTFTLTMNYNGNSAFSEYGQAGQVIFRFDGKMMTFYNAPEIEEVLP